MSVFNRLEIANFLNLDNVLPSEAGWTTHYPHLVLNFRGQSAAVVATNGIGKTSINRAVYALLTRDHEFISSTKRVCAPKRSGAFTHLRLEVLYRDKSIGHLRGQIGTDVPGEPYVIGVYGNADTELVFYAYQGHLEDCPCVERRGTKIRIESNQNFRELLKAQNDCRHNLPREEWNEFIGRHFELAMLAQLVAYQKAGGGDSAEEFFKVKQRRSDGQIDDYDAAFFYEHIAPEVLSHAMRGFAKEGETRFEDTILESASPLIRAELQNERLAKTLERDRSTFAALEKAQVNLRDFVDARQRLDNEVSDLAGEVGFLLNIVEEQPLLGIPPILKDRADIIRHIANRLILQDGGWLVPAAVLGEIWGSEPRAVSQEADRRHLAGKDVRKREVIEIPCDSFSVTSERGPPARAYALEDAIALTEVRTVFASNWNRDEAIRALRYGFEYRSGDGDTNPFRRRKRTLEGKRVAAELERQTKRMARDEFKRQDEDLVAKIRSLKADEYELSLVRNSGLFTDNEIEDLDTTARLVAEAAQTSRSAREAHERRQAELMEGRRAYGEFNSEFADMPDPAAALKGLESRQAAAAAIATQAQELAGTAAARVSTAEQKRQNADHALTADTEEHIRMKAMLEQVERFETAFPGEDPIGLADRIQGEYDNAINDLATLDARRQTAGDEERALLALEPSHASFRTLFPSDPPEGLEAEVKGRLGTARERQKSLLTHHLPTADRQLKDFEQGFAATAQVQAAAEDNVVGLEARLRQRLERATANLHELQPQLSQARTDAATMRQFRLIFGNDADPLAVRHTRQVDVEENATALSSARKRSHDLNRQLDELSRAATAAGRIANEVLETVGKEATRVYQIVEEELTDSSRRSAVLTHFSHVLHAPVARTEDEAWLMLTALDEAGLEAPVFWQDGLREYCRSGAVSVSQHVAVGTLAGQSTLQVQGLADPQKVEEHRGRIQNDLGFVDHTIAKLEQVRADLDTSSERSVLVAHACAAINRSVFLKEPELQVQVDRLETESKNIALLLIDSFVILMRDAEAFAAAGGEEALGAARTHVESLRAELTDLVASLPRLEERASPSSIDLIRSALRFEQAGGQARLEALAGELAEISRNQATLRASLPRLAARRDAIPDVKAAAEFTNRGGRLAIASLISAISRLTQERDQAVVDVETARREATAAAAAARTADQEFAKAGETLATWRRPLAAAQSYLDAGGLSFDTSYSEQLGLLKREEDRHQQRTRFRLAMAANAHKAEREGLGVTSLDRKRSELEKELDAANRRIEELGILLDQLTNQINTSDGYTRRMDKAVVSLIDGRKQARQALADAELSSEAIAAAPRNEAVEVAHASARALRNIVVPDDDRLIAALEEVEGDVRKFALASRIPIINDARRRKDQAWNTYIKGIDSLRNDKSLNLSDTDKVLLDEARTASGLRYVGEIFSAFEQHLARQSDLYEQAKEDIEDQRTKLSESLEAFTLNVSDNFRLLKGCLKPSADGTDAGFEIEADVIERHGIRAAVDKVIALIKMHEEQRSDRMAKQADSESQKEFERRVKDEIRRIFYRAVFTGAGARESADAPHIYLRHPRIGSGRKLRLDRKVSTGQANALALLLLTKMADYAISRDERALLATAGRRRGSLHSTRVVMIDGLFSNVSNRRLIRNSLDAIRGLKGKFQLIGWIHNEAYENDPEIFPEHLGMRRIGESEGFVVVDDGTAQHATAPAEDAIDLGPGAVSVIEMHTDPTPASVGT